MRESGEFPLIPDPAPEEETHYWRFESSDLDVEALRDFIADTKFESEEEIVDLLQKNYRMSSNKTVGEIEMGMTRDYDPSHIIDIVDPTKVLERDASRRGEHLVKILKAIKNKSSHVVIDKYGFFLDEDKLQQLDTALRGTPLSDIEPQAVIRTSIKTLDGKDLDLRIFRVYNRNNKFRYEYILQEK